MIFHATFYIVHSVFTSLLIKLPVPAIFRNHIDEVNMRLLLCCWTRVFAMTSVFSWQNSIGLCPASFHTPRPNLPVCTNLSNSPLQSRPLAQIVKCVPATQETRVQPLSREDPLEKGMATHSSILAWRIPGTEESGGV